MKILYVMPTQYTSQGILFKQEKAFFPTLTLPYLAGLTPKDIEVEIKNDYIEDIDPASGDWDLVGITISTLHSVRGYELADQFRKLGKPVFMGGVHATFMPDEALKHCDSVVVGEAENTLPKLIRDFQNGNLQKRYQAESPHSLRALPSPRYDLIPYDRYRYPLMPVQTSRGCPYDCRYCTVTSLYGRKYRFRPVEEVIEELKAASRTVGSRFVLFVDDNIAAQKDYSYELFEALLPLKIIWICQCALTMADDKELLKLAVRSGMRSAFIGVETLNSESLDRVNKKINRVEEYSERLNTFRNAGVSVSANMIFGFEEDATRTFKETYEFIAKNSIYANLYILTPYPGTRLFEDMDKEGKLLHKDWRKYTAYQQVIKHKRLSKEEMETLFWETYSRLVSPWQNLKRIFKRTLRSYFSMVDWYLHLRIAFYNTTFVSRPYIKRRLPPYF
jgi:radical SAM superfamily enzyme YgiQ (UPF0313 family)